MTPTTFSGLTLASALDRWVKLGGIGKKPATVVYHSEIVRHIRANWPDVLQPVDSITEADCVAFAEKVAHYSAPRYNGIVNALRNMIPVAVCIPRRRVDIIPRNVPTLAELEALLAALETAPMGNAALSIQFLAFTGLRINEARLLRWNDVREDHLYLPGEITKNGKPRCVPFIPGTKEVIDRLRSVKHYHMKTRAGKTREGFVFPQTTCQRALRFASILTGFPRFSHHTFRQHAESRIMPSWPG